MFVLSLGVRRAPRVGQVRDESDTAAADASAAEEMMIAFNEWQQKYHQVVDEALNKLEAVRSDLGQDIEYATRLHSQNGQGVEAFKLAETLYSRIYQSEQALQGSMP